ncbi:MAG: DNA-3-methyladenine glycosylase [Actinobacteria bacterium]|nr:DNA-3-methyladenine glycosylase [Actinomycetota bacterium]MCL6104488.1 DNA-3-methyladenine glycosylase [Actinomycetota bacterium]
MIDLPPLSRSFYNRDPLVVAPKLLNKLFVSGNKVGRIVEVEAYRGFEDPASHAYKGMTKRNASMFGMPGLLYVYFTYGMHFCVNVVCWPKGRPGAVLIRALSPIQKVDTMCNGPAKLAKAFSLDKRYDGIDLVTAEKGVFIANDGKRPPAHPGTGPRVGIKLGTDKHWRWWVQEDPNVS